MDQNFPYLKFFKLLLPNLSFSCRWWTSPVLYSHLQHHNDTIIKTQEDFFINICSSHFIVRFRKGLLNVCVWEGAGDRTELQYFDPHSYGRQRCVFLVLQGCSTGGPEAHSAGWSATSYQQLLLTPTQSGAPSPFGLVWLSLPHLVYNSVRSLTAWLLSWLSYIIVQRPLSRLLDFWNRMDRHQAEITVMQFTGHSLPVHQSMSVPWKFFTARGNRVGGNWLMKCINQFPPTRFPLITTIRMCHFLPVHHLGMAFLAGSKAKIQHLDSWSNLQVNSCLPWLELKTTSFWVSDSWRQMCCILTLDRDINQRFL